MTAVDGGVRTPVECEAPATSLPAGQSTGSPPPPIRLPGLDDAEQQCWQQFHDAATHLYAVLHRELTETYGLTLLDVMLLRLLGNACNGSVRMGELAEALAVIPSRISQQARRLESQGLVCRSRSADDRRVVIATITPEGRTKLKPALRTYARGVRAMYLVPLTRQQMTALGDGCRRVDSGLRGADLTAKPRRG